MIEVGLHPLGQEVFIPRPVLENSFSDLLLLSTPIAALGNFPVGGHTKFQLEKYYAHSTLQELLEH